MLGKLYFGLPFDNISSMRGTLEFALENPTEMANFYCAMAYPGVRFTLRRSVKGMVQKVILDIVSTHMKH